jgi:hypothetical protein
MMYKSNKEIEERKAEIRARELNRISTEEVRIRLLKSLKQESKFEKWFNRKFGWFFTNGMKY